MRRPLFQMKTERGRNYIWAADDEQDARRRFHQYKDGQNISDVWLLDVLPVAERNRKILELHSSGMTNKEIAKRFGISYQRVGQLLKKLA